MYQHLNIEIEVAIIEATVSGDLMRMKAMLQQTEEFLRMDEHLKEMEKQDSFFTMKIVSALAVLKTEIAKLERYG